MLAGEAVRLFRILAGRSDVSPLLNLGSSIRAVRETTQPHIGRELFGPLERIGVRVVHSDLKQADGVDVVGDILDPAVARALGAHGFRCILVANLLEHLRDPAKVAAACEEIVGPGGLIIATVPASYPYHADPIDTGYRPSPDELAGLFSRSDKLLAEELVDRSYAAEFEARGSTVWKEAMRTLLLASIFFVRPRSAAAAIHRWCWYSRPYRVSIALVKVSDALSAGNVRGGGRSGRTRRPSAAAPNRGW